MGGFSLTVSLRKDEFAKIDELMEKYHLKRHEVIKFAIRRFLFPEERAVPLNGRVAEPYPPYEGRMRLKDEGITVHESATSYEEQRVEEQRRRVGKIMEHPTEERKVILKKLSEKDRKELEDLGVSTE